MRIPFDELKNVFYSILLKKGAPRDKAELCARLFAETSLDGVYTHGVNRFPRFIDYIDKGCINLRAEPEKISGFGALEQWDGNLGIGNVNAWLCMGRAVELSHTYGIGAVALRNTNHWMRGGTYGLQAADAGCVGICWTNTMPNMPAWGAKDSRIGNNPLVFAFPNGDNPILTDAAMSQFSYGTLEKYRLAEKKLPFDGGFDKNGTLTSDPGAIEESLRILPTGYWKGAAFSIVLDLIASCISGGDSVKKIGDRAPLESGLSQMFIAIDAKNIAGDAAILKIAQDTAGYVRASERADEDTQVRCPGDGMLARRRENTEKGIPVEESVWSQIKSLMQ